MARIDYLPPGEADLRPDVVLLCDLCMATQVPLGRIPLVGYDPHERYPILRPAAAAKGWAIRENQRVWQCVCPACLLAEAEKQAACPHHACTCADCGATWDQAGESNQPQRKRSWTQRLRGIFASRSARP